MGITEHQDSAKITRFVERFRYAEWITPRMVRTWTAARDKPSSEKCREFMQQIVGMGYATNNGETGREFKIKILSSSPLSPLGTQTHTQYTSERSPLGSPDVVHVVHFESDRQRQNLAVLEVDMPVTSAFHPNNLDLSITDVFANGNISDPTGSDEVKDNLSSSPEVDYVDYKWTTKWTTPKHSPDEDLNPKWTKWTTPIHINVGDRVRYRGKGENGLFTLKGLKTDELTIVAINDDFVEVSNPRWLTTQNIPVKDLEKI